MDLTIFPHKLSGTVTAIPSKSQAHRLLICAAFARGNTELSCPQTSRDIEATADCLRALGAEILRTDSGYRISPCTRIPEKAVLNCCESGSTLRFLLPVAGALGVDATFRMEGRLFQRPLSPLWEEMERMGCQLSRPSENTVRCSGKLKNGSYHIDGSVSSQFITGLLLALSILGGDNRLAITGKTESQPYIDITKDALRQFSADPEHPGSLPLISPGKLNVEGDWSNGAFFLAASYLGSHVTVKNLHPDSPQGDRVAPAWLEQMQKGFVHISGKDIPDLVPILAIAAGNARGAEFTDVQRLRLKESDRIASTAAMISALGGKTEITENTLTVFPFSFTGGTVDACGDHRIAMSAAIAATCCSGPVTILGAEAVSKSYPGFWEEYKTLGGQYEQYLR